ncbi:Dynamin-like GTPase that mediates homotypic ER fusion [Collariella sp. IMI 366227]|nr:Dynamin-like GTPase that mediates homotypic ER fusion [Collariella sp. IMI 366227]
MLPNIDPAILEALGLEATSSKLISHGGSGFSSTYKLTSTKDGKELAFFIKTGTGPEAEVMFREYYIAAMNGHFAPVGSGPEGQHYEHGIQVIDEEKAFKCVQTRGFQASGQQTDNALSRSSNLNDYLTETRVAEAGFNYHLVSVFGSQSTGKSTLLNHLFGTEFNVMSESQRRQTTKGIWMSKNKRAGAANNMADRLSQTRSLLFFVIRDHIGNTPLANLRDTLIQDLTRIWSTISKPQGLENSKIEDYFDFAFAALPHKILQPDKFIQEVDNLSTRFATGHRASKDLDQEFTGGVFLPEYHRRIPADGLSLYASGIWDQIVHNKDLDLPTQQELLAQFRCDEIAREVLTHFDAVVVPLEEQQAEATRQGRTSSVIPDLGATGAAAREKCVAQFETQASRYHRGVYAVKRAELESKIDTRLKALYHAQLSAAHKAGVAAFSDAVTNAVKAGQKAGGAYEFAEIVDKQKKKTLEIFKKEAQSLLIQGVAWTNFKPQYRMFEKELDEVSARLRKEEMRRLAIRVERWVKSRLGDAVGLEFNKLGSGRGGSGAPEAGEKPATEKDLWDRVWAAFVGVVKEAETRFADRAKSFEASAEEVEVGLWRLRRKSWVALREKIEEEMMESNILMKLRENFEDKFRYDDEGVPRIWRPTDDIEGVYTRARESTLALIPLLARFRLAETFAAPDLPAFIGAQPAGAEPEDEEDLAPIGGVDEEEGKSLEEEMTVLGESKRQDLVVRFKKMADGVYVEAKRSAIGGITQVPLYFYAILLVLGWNEIVMVLRNPVLFMLLLVMGAGGYVAYTLNLLGPMFQMVNAARNQGVEIGKEKLRSFLENNETVRNAIAMPVRQGSSGISMDKLDSKGKKAQEAQEDDDF